MTEPPDAAGRESALLSEIRALRSELEILRGVTPGGRPGKWVIAFFVGLIALSMVTAFTLWTAARNTARARAARVTTAPSLSRIDLVGRGLVHGVQECLSSAEVPGGAASILMRVKLTPAGTVGLLQAEVSPAESELVPCVRRIPSVLRLPPPPEGQSPDAADIELRYDEQAASAGAQSARWSWTLAAPPKPLLSRAPLAAPPAEQALQPSPRAGRPRLSDARRRTRRA